MDTLKKRTSNEETLFDLLALAGLFYREKSRPKKEPPLFDYTWPMNDFESIFTLFSTIPYCLLRIQIKCKRFLPI